MPTSPTPESILKTMTADLRQLLTARQIDDPCMIGIHTGGVWVAEALHRELGIQQALGTLSITFYRDDFTRIGMHPQVEPSNLPFPVDDRHIVLVDDVLHTGRTIRAALNEIFDYGRPASVILATLVDRGGRELPIAADITGLKLDLAANQHVKLSNTGQLRLEIQESK